MTLSPISRMFSRWQLAGGLVALIGLVAIILSPLIGRSTSDRLWGVEPLVYIGAVLMIVGLATLAASYILPIYGKRGNPDQVADSVTEQWSAVTQQYFDLFHHDLGRPFTRIVAKERELRTKLASLDEEASPDVLSLLDEIERQSPNFRIMLSNIQVLVHLEAPDVETGPRAVEPSEVVRRIVDRYSAVAADANKEITWWSEPAEFGIVHSDEVTSIGV